MNDSLKAQWADFAAEVPWLMESDRGTVELVCHLRHRLHGNDITAAEIGHLRSAYNDCGASPSSKSKVSVPDDGDDDPLAEFLN